MSIRVGLRLMARSAVAVPAPPLLSLVTGELTTLINEEGSVFGTATKLFYETADYPPPAYLRTIDLDTLAKHTVYTHATNRFRHWQGYYSEALGKYVLAGEYPPTSADIMTVDVGTDTVNFINLDSDEFIAVREWGGYLYVGARKTDPAHAPKTGGAIWRCAIADILTVGEWSKVWTHPSEYGINTLIPFLGKLIACCISGGNVDIYTTENGTDYSLIKQIAGQLAGGNACLFRDNYVFGYVDNSRHVHVVYSADLSSWTDWDTGITLPSGHTTYGTHLGIMGTDRLLIAGIYGLWELHGTMSSVLYETRDLANVIHIADLNGDPSLYEMNTHTINGVFFAPHHRPTPADSGGKILVIKPRKWRANGEDFRVLEGAAQRSIWVEQVGALPLIWTKVPSIGAGATVTLYAYYGNPDVASVSDADATFMFHDDFEGDLSKWGIGGTPVIVEENGTGNHVCEFLIPPAPPNPWIYTHRDDPSWTDYGVKFRHQHKVAGANGPRAVFRLRMRSVAAIWCSLENRIGSIGHPYWWLNERFGGADHERDTDGTSYPLNTWWTIENRVVGSSFAARRNGAAWMSGTLTTADYGGVDFGSADPGNKMWIDDVFIYKLASPEPSVSVGAEESGLWTIDGDIYKYRREVTIDNTGGGALSDYQILIRFPAI